jgi:hypothetical protein
MAHTDAGLAAKGAKTHESRHRQALLERLATRSDSTASEQFAQLPAAERKSVLDQAGKEAARIMASGVLAEMLAGCGKSQRELDEDFGFDHTALSKAARGVGSQSGPQLWKLIALAEALGYEITLTARPK